MKNKPNKKYKIAHVTVDSYDYVRQEGSRIQVF